MKIHKEGVIVIFWILVFLILLNSILFKFIDNQFFQIVVLIISILFFMFVLRFFRRPDRGIVIDENNVFAPADGKVLVIEETEENEYFKEKRIQVSIFMSIWNVHINWYPISGIIKYFKYHPGKFLIARKPKSSTDNERTTLVIENKNNVQLLVRQIAGAVARRIISYPKEGNSVKQGNELGFIRFGSRVDVFLPLSAKINVKLYQKVKGKQTILAKLN